MCARVCQRFAGAAKRSSAQIAPGSFGSDERWRGPLPPSRPSAPLAGSSGRGSAWLGWGCQGGA